MFLPQSLRWNCCSEVVQHQIPICSGQQQGEQAVAGDGGCLWAVCRHPSQTSLMLSRRVPMTFRPDFNRPLRSLPVLGRARALHCEMFPVSVLSLAPLWKLTWTWRWNLALSGFLHEAQTLLIFLYKGGEATCWWQALCDVDFQEPETVHLLHLSSGYKTKVFLFVVFSTPFSKTQETSPRFTPVWTCYTLVGSIPSQQLYMSSSNCSSWITESQLLLIPWDSEEWTKVPSKCSNTHSCDYAHSFSEAWTAGQLWSSTLNQPREPCQSMQHGARCIIGPTRESRRNACQEFKNKA